MKLLLLLTSTFLVLSACQKKSEQEGDDFKIRQATSQIDKGDYDGAIASMQKLKAQSANPKISMVLASAYAARAGVKVENYWGFTVGYEALLPEVAEKQAELEQNKFFQSETVKGLSKVIEPKLMTQVNEGFVQLNRIMSRIEKIPYSDREKRVDVQQAVKELTGVKTQGAALYKAILEIVLLRSAIGDIRDRVTHLTSKSLSPCQDDAEELLNWLQYSYQLLANIVADVAEAYPSRKPDLEKVSGILQANEKFLAPASWTQTLVQLKVCE